MPPDVTVISRTDLLKFYLTCNPKIKRDAVIEKYIDQIKANYTVVGKVENMFQEFHSLLMGKDEAKLDEYLERYGNSEIHAFCNGRKRISPRSRARYPSPQVLDLLKETTTNSKPSNELYTVEVD